MEWRLEGDVLIACNCDYGCPCNFNAPPSRGKCEGGWIWSIDEGRLGELALDGLAVALFCDWPGAIHEGGGRAVAYLDERADSTQRDALTRLLRGELGGPWGIFRNTYALAEPTPAHFELSLAGHATRARIGQNVELELTAIRNPVTHAEVHPEVVLPEGLVTKHGHMAASRVFRVRDEVGFDHSGQYAAFARFRYTS